LVSNKVYPFEELYIINSSETSESMPPMDPWFLCNKGLAKEFSLGSNYTITELPFSDVIINSQENNLRPYFFAGSILKKVNPVKSIEILKEGLRVHKPFLSWKENFYSLAPEGLNFIYHPYSAKILKIILCGIPLTIPELSNLLINELQFSLEEVKIVWYNLKKPLCENISNDILFKTRVNPLYGEGNNINIYTSNDCSKVYRYKSSITLEQCKSIADYVVSESKLIYEDHLLCRRLMLTAGLLGLVYYIIS
jgi:hypothetical protein